LSQCDVLIAGASGSSLGVGFEVGYVLGRAAQTNQRVVMLHNAARTVSNPHCWISVFVRKSLCDVYELLFDSLRSHDLHLHILVSFVSREHFDLDHRNRL
jgi:hypothetical protein